MNKYLFFVFTLFLPLKILSQGIANPYQATEDNLKSPQVHLLKQFVDHPVDLSRGLVDISIPIYDIAFAGKTIPINLLFHASGLKANVTENGILGLKWALNAGGFISREVRGYPDERKDHKQGIYGLSYTPDWITLYGATSYTDTNYNVVFGSNLGYVGYPQGTQGKYEDTEYDIFTFSLPNGQSGKFILKDNNGIKSASFIPYKPYKLNNPLVEYKTIAKSFMKFELTDDEGYVYTFGKDDANKEVYEQSINHDYINNWLLTSIVSPNKKETIKFNYIFRPVSSNNPLTPVIINDYVDEYNYYMRRDLCQGNIAGYYSFYNAVKSQLDDPGGNFQRNYNEPPYLSQDSHILSNISYNDVDVNFIYREEVNDINRLLLSKIEISKANDIIKKIDFEVASPGGGTPTTFEKPSYLNSVSIKGKTEEVIEKYSFDYHHLDKLPAMDKLAHSADYWGYYNSDVTNIILKDTIDLYFTYPHCHEGLQTIFKKEIGSGNDRYSNAQYMKIGMIKSITYPTGGKTFFDYEANQYQENAIIRNCGGLRIKSIINVENNGTNLKKREFTYGLSEEGTGQIPPYLSPSDYGFRNYFEDIKTFYYIHDDLNIERIDGQGSYWTRYITGFFPGNFYTFLYNLVSYDKVTEYIGDSSNNIGKIENYYSINIPHRDLYEFEVSKARYMKYKYSIDASNFWNGNHLSKKIEYKRNNNIYSKVKQTDYSYTARDIDEFYDLSVFRHKMFVGYGVATGSNTNLTSTIELERIKDNPRDFFGFKTQHYISGVENLYETKEKLYVGNDSIVQSTINEYDLDKPTFLKERTTINSKGESITQKFSYPFNSNTGVYSQMTIANVISPVVENITLNNNKVTGSALLTYKKSDDNFVPDKHYAAHLSMPEPFTNFTAYNGSTKDSSYGADPENTYDAYDDHGNPTQITSKGKVTTVYVWGYEKDYPIAKIENATYTAGQPNTITAAQQALINNAIAATINETTAVTETILREKLQLLRAGFPDAMVTTFTYDPLIGITSMTDPKDYTTYYEYDSYGRLKQVRDKENKVLSANRYNYKNQ